VMRQLIVENPGLVINALIDFHLIFLGKAA